DTGALLPTARLSDLPRFETTADPASLADAAAVGPGDEDTRPAEPPVLAPISLDLILPAGFAAPLVPPPDLNRPNGAKVDPVEATTGKGAPVNLALQGDPGLPDALGLTDTPNAAVALPPQSKPAGPPDTPRFALTLTDAPDPIAAPALPVPPAHDDPVGKGTLPADLPVPPDRTGRAEALPNPPGVDTAPAPEGVADGEKGRKAAEDAGKARSSSSASGLREAPDTAPLPGADLAVRGPGIWQAVFAGATADPGRERGEPEALARVLSAPTPYAPLGDTPRFAGIAATAKAGAPILAAPDAATAEELSAVPGDTPHPGETGFFANASPGSLATAPGAAGGAAGVAASLPQGALPQLAAAIGATLSQRNGGTEFTLAPEELGHVRVTLHPESQGSDRVVVMLSFDRLGFAQSNGDGRSGDDGSQSGPPSGSRQDQTADTPFLPPPLRVAQGALDLRL
ncbi:MAG: hypothetical protein B7Z31_05945, partial [Rhodobacterales bacterium 12-65-15]